MVGMTLYCCKLSSHNQMWTTCVLIKFRWCTLLEWRAQNVSGFFYIVSPLLLLCIITVWVFSINRLLSHRQNQMFTCKLLTRQSFFPPNKVLPNYLCFITSVLPQWFGNPDSSPFCPHLLTFKSRSQALAHGTFLRETFRNDSAIPDWLRSLQKHSWVEASFPCWNRKKHKGNSFWGSVIKSLQTDGERFQT